MTQINFTMFDSPVLEKAEPLIRIRPIKLEKYLRHKYLSNYNFKAF